MGKVHYERPSVPSRDPRNKKLFDFRALMAAWPTSPGVFTGIKLRDRERMKVVHTYHPGESREDV